MATPKRKFGSAVNSSMAEAWKPEKVGDSIVGQYRGMEMVPGPGNRKPFASFHFTLEDGTLRGIASAMLVTKMNQIPRGAWVQLTYTGLFESKNGKSPDYDVVPEEGTVLLDPIAEAEKEARRAAAELSAIKAERTNAIDDQPF